MFTSTCGSTLRKCVGAPGCVGSAFAIHCPNKSQRGETAGMDGRIEGGRRDMHVWLADLCDGGQEGGVRLNGAEN